MHQFRRFAHRHSLLFASLIIALALSILSGCSATSSSASSVSLSAPSSVSPPIANAPRTAVVGIPQDFESLDPHLDPATGTQEVMFNVFTGLVNTDTSGAIIPEIASSWQVSEDQLRYTFVLRQGAVFHDGSPIRPEDVRYSLERLQGKTADQTTALSSSFASVTAISIEQPDKVILELSAIDASLLSKMIVAIIPEGSGPQQAQHPIGAGPFRFVSYSPGVSLKLAKHEGFYQQGLPKLDEVEFRIFDAGSSSAAFLALQNAEIDILNITLEQREVLESPAFADKFEVLCTPQNMVQLFALNTEFAPFADLRVRQALNHAVNKDEIIALLAPGSQKLGTNFCEVMSFYAASGLENTYPYDPAKAIELLAAAGYGDLTFTVRVPSAYEFHLNTAQIIESQLRQVGVTMLIEPIEWTSWLSEVYTSFVHQATLIGFTGKLDPDPILGRFASMHPNNLTRFKNARVDELLVLGKSTSIEAERAPFYKELQVILAEEVPAIFIMDITLYRAVNRRLTGLPSYPIGFIDMKSVTLK